MLEMMMSLAASGKREREREGGSETGGRREWQQWQQWQHWQLHRRRKRQRRDCAPPKAATARAVAMARTFAGAQRLQRALVAEQRLARLHDERELRVDRLGSGLLLLALNVHGCWFCNERGSAQRSKEHGAVSDAVFRAGAGVSGRRQARVELGRAASCPAFTFGFLIRCSPRMTNLTRDEG